MTDKPKCPPKVWGLLDDRGVFVTIIGSRNETAEQLLRETGLNAVEYIPRHVADQQARDAVRQALEAERAAQHAEEND